MNKPKPLINDFGLLVVGQIEAMLAYWDKDQVCRFANNAYMEWFGKSQEEMIDKMTLKELLGPLYEQNLPYITEALKGHTQCFEREIEISNGEIRWLLANYYPDFYEGNVRGFSVHVSDITEKRRLDTALEMQKSNELLYTIFNDSPAGISISNLQNGKWMDVNSKFLELFGFESKDEVIGKTAEESNILYRPEDRAEIAQMLKENKIIKDRETRIKTKKGEDKWLSGSVTIIEFENTPCMLAISEDITERKQAEELLKESEDKFRSLFNFCPLGILLTSAEGKPLEANPAVLEVMGMESLEELMNKPKVDYYVKPDERVKMFNLFRKNGFVKDFEVEVKKGNGEHAWISNNLAYFQFGNKDIQMISSAVDITKRKNAEDALADSEKKFRDLINFSPLGISLSTTQGKILEVNQAIIDIFGFASKEEFINTPAVERYVNPNDRIKLIDLFKKEGTVRDYEVQAKKKNGELVWLNNCLIPFEMPDGEKALLSTTQNITDLKKTLLQLQDVNKELDAFTYSVSHDLRAPLRAVNGYAQMLNEDYGTKLDAEGKRIIEILCKNAIAKGTLIDELLAFSKLGRTEVRRTKINMNELVESVVADMDKALTHYTEIKINKLPDVQADYGMLRQVMFNLIANALKYSSKKEKPIVEIFSEKKQNEIVFSVKDNGAGFDMKYYDKLFGVFQRLHKQSEFEGVGVGLAIVQRVITKHGGKVWAEGAVNEGAIFKFSLLTT